MDSIDILFTAIIAAVVIVGNWFLEPSGRRRHSPYRSQDAPPRPALPPGPAEATAPPSLTAAAPRSPVALPPQLDLTRRNLLRLQSLDPNFSLPLFADFLLALFARYHAVRGGEALSPLRPWISPHLLQGLRLRRGITREQGIRVQGIVVGSVRLRVLDVRRDFTTVSVDLGATLHECRKDATEELCLEERWFLRRRNDLLSPDPEDMREPGCPSCGYVDDEGMDGDERCPGCKEIVLPGRHGWCITEIDQLSRIPRIEAALPEAPPVLDLDRPLVQAVDYATQRKDFDLRHPGFAWPVFADWVARLWLHLEGAWAEGNWKAARPFETDRIFQRHLYRLSLLRARGWNVHMEEAEVLAVEPSRFERDAWFESISLRVTARRRIWCTAGEEGQITAGVARETRDLMEYCTLIRRREAPVKPSLSTLQGCPACGAPFEKVDLFGDCGACGSHLSGGERGWVLSGVDLTGQTVF